MTAAQKRAAALQAAQEAQQTLPEPTQPAQATTNGSHTEPYGVNMKGLQAQALETAQTPEYVAAIAALMIDTGIAASFAADAAADAPAAITSAIDTYAPNLNLNAIAFMSKADVVIDNIANDSYWRVAIDMRNSGSGTPKLISVWRNNGSTSTDVTMPGDEVITRITHLQYGVSSVQGASALAGFKRYAEASMTIYAAVIRDASGQMIVTRLLEWVTSDKAFKVTGNIDKRTASDDDKKKLAGLSNRFIRRMLKGESPQDKRTGGYYQRWIDQRKAARQ